MADLWIQGLTFEALESRRRDLRFRRGDMRWKVENLSFPTRFTLSRTEMTAPGSEGREDEAA